MRWPNRHPHQLTGGMRRAQKGLADFVGLIDWARFARVNLNEEVKVAARHCHAFACGDDAQAVVWLLRRDTITKAGTLDGGAKPMATRVTVPGLAAGHYRITPWNTAEGRAGEALLAVAETEKAGLSFETPPFAADLALAIRRADT